MSRWEISVDRRDDTPVPPSGRRRVNQGHGVTREGEHQSQDLAPDSLICSRV
jgi:hypothetical protein